MTPNYTNCGKFLCSMPQQLQSLLSSKDVDTQGLLKLDKESR